MKNLLLILLYISSFTYAQNRDGLSQEDRQLVKDAEQAKKNTEQKQLKPTILGDDSSAPFGGYSYETWEGGKYYEVAQAENWSPFAMPDNAEERLKDYNQNKNIKIFTSVFITFAAILALILYYFRRKKEVDDASLSVDIKELLQKDKEELEEKIRLLKEMAKSKLKSEEEAKSDIELLKTQFHEKTANFIKDSQNIKQEQLLKRAFDKGLITEEEFMKKSL